MKNAIYRLKISALIPEIFKLSCTLYSNMVYYKIHRVNIYEKYYANYPCITFLRDIEKWTQEQSTTTMRLVTTQSSNNECDNSQKSTIL